MPITPTYPGVYIEELPGGVRAITGVSTSVTAFIGRTRRGPVNKATLIHGYADHERIFGRLWRDSPMSYAVQHYFLNGGRDAVIVRVHNGATAATLALTAGAGTLTLEAANPGTWGRMLRAQVNHGTRSPGDTELFNLIVEDGDSGARETFLNVSVDAASTRFITTTLSEESKLVRAQGRAVPRARPDATSAPVQANQASGSDGSAVTDIQIEGSATAKTGIYALDVADIFNLLCIPPYHYDPTQPNPDPSSSALSKALAYCKKRRAMLILDPPVGWTDKDKPRDASAGIDSAAFGVARDENAVLYFPRILSPDPEQENRLATFAPCGAIAGVIARTDAQRGVWKAPAGIELPLLGVSDLSVKLTDLENGELNPVGVNCLRMFPEIGPTVWGARTLRGADRLADQWKYLPVRRLALYIEESLFRGTQWVVFEPNDEPLWAQIRLNVGAFMNGLFRQGAFQGASPREAYLVRCDRETTTQDDVNRGVVNILVGFAPLQPAEFVIIKIQQLASTTR